MKHTAPTFPLLPTLLALMLSTTVMSAGPDHGDSSLHRAALANPAVDRPLLFDALGGEAGIARLSSAFIRALAANEVTRVRFAESDIQRFDDMLQLQLCQVSGGPCDYTGDTMERVHGGMDITHSEFNHTVAALMEAMDDIDLAQGTQNRLLAVLAPMRSRIAGQ